MIRSIIRGIFEAIVFASAVGVIAFWFYVLA